MSGLLEHQNIVMQDMESVPGQKKCLAAVENQDPAKAIQVGQV